LALEYSAAAANGGSPNYPTQAKIRLEWTTQTALREPGAASHAMLIPLSVAVPDRAGLAYFA
jgi:hypothetical protein